MVDRRIRGPNKSKGEKGPNRPGSDTTPFEGLRVEKYLKKLRETGVHILAREYANVCGTTVKRKRDKDPAFAEAEQQALEGHDATIDREVHRRGVKGVQEAIYYEGAVVGWRTAYSDRMLELYAKRRMPAYRDKVTLENQHSGGVAVGMADLSKLSPDGRKLLRELLSKEGDSGTIGQEP